MRRKASLSIIAQTNQSVNATKSRTHVADTGDTVFSRLEEVNESDDDTGTR